ncbi:MAG TPA: hypothetical protein VHJ17_20720 [Thermomonospora sp.]|nr:hypothetical protein [Thermomonospora sp.]
MLEVKRCSIYEACAHLRLTPNPDHDGKSPYTVFDQFCQAWRIPEYCARWQPTTLDRVAALPAEKLLLYVDDQGPLVPARDLHKPR